MKQAKTYLCLGIWLLALPFLGFPGSWKTAFLVFTAFLLFLASLRAYLGSRQESAAASRTLAESFVENGERDERDARGRM